MQAHQETTVHLSMSSIERDNLIIELGELDSHHEREEGTQLAILLQALYDSDPIARKGA